MARFWAWANYMQSETWGRIKQAKYQQVIRKYGRMQCERCGEPFREAPHCHHVRYKDRHGNSIFGYEDIERDLQLLCYDCHLSLHPHHLKSK